MYQKANPARGRSQEEKDDLKQKYTPGEQVLPDVAVQKADSDDERMLAEVREMSLREAGVQAPGSYERGTRHRTTDRHRDPRRNGQSGARRQQAAMERETPASRSHRQIGHQSSLRSIMSSSDIDSSDMEEEILRLVDEGWLDGIDLNSLDTSQVDELSEHAIGRHQLHQTPDLQLLAEHVITHGVDPGSKVDHKPLDQIWLQVKHDNTHAHLCQGPVFLRHTPHLRVNSVERQANKGDKPHRLPGLQTEGYPPEITTKRLRQQPICQRDHQARTLARGPLSMLTRIEEDLVPTIISRIVPKTMHDLSLPTIKLELNLVMVRLPSAVLNHSRDLHCLLDLQIQVVHIVEVFLMALSVSATPSGLRILRFHHKWTPKPPHQPPSRSCFLQNPPLLVSVANGKIFSMNFIGIAPDANRANTISVCNAIAMAEDVFTGMASGTQHYSAISGLQKTPRSAKIYHLPICSSGTNIDIRSQKRCHLPYQEAKQ
ncbi:MAG: hypothetical protein Q9222_007118 [Ikaeria aurantiellina]